MEIPQMYTKAEVAKMLNVSVQTIRRKMRSGELGYYMICSRPRFTMEDVQEYMERTKENGGKRRKQER